MSIAHYFHIKTTSQRPVLIRRIIGIAQQTLWDELILVYIQ